jgi:hypothetical protein
MRNSICPAFASPALLWGARILTIVILSFWGFFIVAHLFGDAGASSRALTPNDYGSLFAMVASLLGLGLSFKWERFGATITIIAVAIGAVLNWKVLLFPGTLIPIAAVLFLWHSYLRNVTRREQAAA